MFLQSPADIAIYGGGAGGGKSYSLLLEPLYHKDNPNFSAVFFRRTSPQITLPGGLWDQSTKIYPQTGAVPTVGNLRWKFPSGSTVRFSHLQHDKNIFDFQGSELPLIIFDELTHFSADQFWYLLSRNRSMCGVKPYVRASCNPDADSWVAKLLSWWIDTDGGLPINDRAGKLRWFVRVNDRLEWADSKKELAEKYPSIPAKSLTFIPAKLTDNPALLAADPGYLANLLVLPMVERERLLGGNWKIRPAAGLVFNRAWFQIVPVAPSYARRRVRAWDKASTPGAGDWTCGVLISVGDDGIYWIESVIRGQWSAAERNRIIQQTAQMDGPETEIWIEQEGGSGGKESAEISVRELVGFSVHTDRVTGDKLTRARPFAAQCEAGNVRIVAGEWNDAYLDELHGFPERKSDDQVDASSLGFNKLANAFRGIWSPEPSPGTSNRSTVLSSIPSDAGFAMPNEGSFYKKW